MARATAARRQTQVPKTKEQKATDKAAAKREFDKALKISNRENVPVKEPAVVPIEGSAGHSAIIAVSLIKPSAENPRTHFDEAALKELGESLIQGQVCPLVVRRINDSEFELIDGERRWRAARMVGIVSLRAEIRECTEAEAALLRLVSFQRQDLSPIEEARGLQLMVQKYEVSQRELAAKLKVSQGHIGNRLRLLKLPDTWQSRVISGEITATQARELATWADLPNVLERLHELLEDGDDWNVALVDALEDLSEPVEGYLYREGVNITLTFTDEQLAQLDVRDVPNRWQTGTNRRAFNDNLYQELTAKLIEKKKKKVTSKQSKEVEADQAKPAKSQAEKTKELLSRVAKWKARWNQLVVAEWFKTEATTFDCVGLFAFASVQREGIRVFTSLEEAWPVAFGKKMDSRKDETQVYSAVRDIKDVEKLRILAAGLIQHGELSPWRMISPKALEHFAELAAINWSDKWIQFATRADDWLESLLRLFQVEQLEALNKEWRLAATGTNKAILIADMVNRFRESKKVPAMPSIVLKASAKDVTSW